MENFEINRDKYLKILNESGVSAAITALHHDSEKMEFETFEGRSGYDEKKYAYLESVREFSRELWRSSLIQNTKV